MQQHLLKVKDEAIQNKRSYLYLIYAILKLFKNSKPALPNLPDVYNFYFNAHRQLHEETTKNPNRNIEIDLDSVLNNNTQTQLNDKLVLVGSTPKAFEQSFLSFDLVVLQSLYKNYLNLEPSEYAKKLINFAYSFTGQKFNEIEINRGFTIAMAEKQIEMSKSTNNKQLLICNGLTIAQEKLIDIENKIYSLNLKFAQVQQEITGNLLLLKGARAAIKGIISTDLSFVDNLTVRVFEMVFGDDWAKGHIAFKDGEIAEQYISKVVTRDNYKIQFDVAAKYHNSTKNFSKEINPILEQLDSLQKRRQKLGTGIEYIKYQIKVMENAIRAAFISDSSALKNWIGCRKHHPIKRSC